MNWMAIRLQFCPRLGNVRRGSRTSGVRPERQIVGPWFREDWRDVCHFELAVRHVTLRQAQDVGTTPSNVRVPGRIAMESASSTCTTGEASPVPAVERRLRVTTAPSIVSLPARRAPLDLPLLFPGSASSPWGHERRHAVGLRRRGRLGHGAAAARSSSRRRRSSRSFRTATMRSASGLVSAPTCGSAELSVSGHSRTLGHGRNPSPEPLRVPTKPRQPRSAVRPRWHGRPPTPTHSRRRPPTRPRHTSSGRGLRTRSTR